MSLIHRTVLVAAFALAALLGSAQEGQAASAVQWKVVTELDRFEPFDALVFHDGRLWVGRSRKNLSAEYKLEIFDSAGTLLETKTLTHSLRFLYPHGAHGVFTLGVSYQDQLTHYTTVTRQGAGFQVRSKTIPVEAFANEFAGKPGALYFTDPGGLDDGSMGKPLRTLFTFQGSRPRYLQARIPGPHYPTLAGNSLYVVENPTIASGGRYLVRVDLKTETPTRVLEGSNIANVLSLEDGKLLALADRGAAEVIVLNTVTGAVVKRLPVAAGTPRGLAVLGNCLVVGSEESKKLTFLDLRTDKVQGEWDLSVVGNKLYGLRSVAADSATGRVYVRSSYPDFVGNASPDPDRNSVVLAEEADGTTFKACR